MNDSLNGSVTQILFKDRLALIKIPSSCIWLPFCTAFHIIIGILSFLIHMTCPEKHFIVEVRIFPII